MKGVFVLFVCVVVCCGEMLSNLPYELQLYIYEFDDNQYYKSLFGPSLAMITHYNSMSNIVSYLASMYHYHNIHYVNCTSSSSSSSLSVVMTCSQYILHHSKKYGHIMIYRYIRPSHIRHY